MSGHPEITGEYWGPTFNGDPVAEFFDGPPIRESRPKIHFRKWLPVAAPIARVIGCHGYGEHSGRYYRLAQALNAAGIEFWMLDLPGHGHTAPNLKDLGKGIPKFPVLVDCIEAFVTHVLGSAEDHALPFFLFGHSWGGALTFLASLRPSIAAVLATGPVDAVQKSDVAGRGVILSAPAFRVSGNSLCPKPYWGFFRGVANVMSTIAPSLSSPGAKSDDLTCSAELNQATEDSDFTFGSTITAHNGNQLVLTGMEARTTAVGCKASLLLLHGLADAICPPYGSEEILNAVSSEDKQRITYDGLKHEILNEAVGGVQVANNIITFIKGRL